MNRPDPKLLEELMVYRMPFGEYKDTRICNLPTFYLEWFAVQGFPAGKLGMLLSTMHVIRTNGLEHLLGPLRK
ncbi:MAG: DUF3820 family protein [Flavobacteriales bacterium]|nr:DUF3820 family protein [Flavobacteriales bacterium]